ncbi:MAG: HlyC/CorC family transporter [Oscillospiraceae bacterium]|nr:HlyC/CorC family transporter [Oscillospiraceae bacterium]
MSVPAYIGVIVGLLILSAFFSGSEIAYSTVSRLRLETAADRRRSAAWALAIHDRFEDALSTILIGNNLVNLFASSVAAMLALALAGPSASLSRQDLYTTVAAVLLAVCVLVFGESVPKIAARDRALSCSLLAAYPLRVLMTLLLPLTKLTGLLVRVLTLPFRGEQTDEEEQAEVAEEELVSLIETSEDSGVIDEDVSELLQNALDFSEISAQEVMTPRVDVSALDLDDDAEPLADRLDRETFSRLPVFDEDLDHILGILSLNRYYRALLSEPEPDIRRLLITPAYVYKTTKLPAVLETLRLSHTHMAVVTDDYGGTLGILTMEDVLEQLVGEIWDETDEVVDEVVPHGDREWEIDGDLTIGDFCELIGRDEDLFETESVTVGGWTMERFDGFPEPGDSFRFEDLTVRVLETGPHRVNRILVTRADPEEE